MGNTTRIHNSFVYWCYKYIFFGILSGMNLIVGIALIYDQTIDLFIGFMILILVSCMTFIIFQIKFKRLYITGDLVVLKGFFFGENQFHRELIVFHTRDRSFSFGLIELFMTVKESGKSYKIVTNRSNLHAVKKAKFCFI